MNTELWARFVERLKNQINDRCLAYLENLTCCNMSDTEWNLCLPDRASLNFVESNLYEKLHEVIHDVLEEANLSSDVDVNLSIEGEASFYNNKKTRSLFDPMCITDISTPVVEKAAFRVRPQYDVPSSDVLEAVPFVPDIRLREESCLNERFTFDNFIQGGSNEFAYCLSKAVATNPGTLHNPLFIYGGVGLGKTHLMQAIGNELLEAGNLRVRYMTCEKFTNDYMLACAKKTLEEFREQVRTNCDVLLLDDVQFLSGKSETQKEFFNVFNELLSNNKQVVLTSDRHPHEIAKLEERISSRCLGGVITDMQLPEYETRLSIIRKKSRDEHFYMPEDVAQYIATKVVTNVRELEGCIKRIKACADVRNEHINMALAQKMIEPFYSTKTVMLNADTIIDVVSRYFGISSEELLGKSRAKPYVYPRQIAMYLVRHHTSLSFPEIGRAFKRDHTTVLSADQRITKGLADKQDATLQSDIKRLEDELAK